MDTTFDTNYQDAVNVCIAYSTALKLDPHARIGLSLSGRRLAELPACTPRVVTHVFICSDNKLKSLRNCPQIVYGDFDCCFNPDIVSLEHCPDEIHGRFWSTNFTDSEYREFAAKRKALKQSLEGTNDEAGLGQILDLI